MGLNHIGTQCSSVTTEGFVWLRTGSTVVFSTIMQRIGSLGDLRGKEGPKEELVKHRALMPVHALCCLDALAPRLWLPMMVSWETAVLWKTLWSIYWPSLCLHRTKEPVDTSPWGCYFVRDGVLVTEGGGHLLLSQHLEQRVCPTRGVKASLSTVSTVLCN